MSQNRFDLAVIGGGIVGLATTLALRRKYPDANIVVLEKEQQVAQHQTGHNSGVVHSGIYYRPGSLKAELCVRGVGLLKAYCRERGLAYDECGKLIVAVNDKENAQLETLFQRGRDNGVPDLAMLEGDEIRVVEPHAAGLRAILSPRTAIVDYAAVANSFRRDLEAQGVTVRTGFGVTVVERHGNSSTLRSRSGAVEVGYFVNCAGLHSDRIARLSGEVPEVQIVPFRGEYYFLVPERRGLVRGLIYPVPDPDLPFLGVHFTKTVDSRVEAGPNAVLALAREGYTRTRFHPGDMIDAARYGGFWRVTARFWKTGIYEYYRSFSKRAFVRSLQTLVPEVRAQDLVPGGAGVRAQAVTRRGELVDDFRIIRSEGALHVLNAPSPAATASLAIGDYLAQQAV